MRIKQQKAIRQFLIDELGEEKGGSLFEDQNKLLVNMIGEVSSEERSRYKTLAQTILPLQKWKPFWDSFTYTEPRSSGS